jgi:multiple sugar transport system permease protein
MNTLNWRFKDKSAVYFFILPVILTLMTLLVYPFGYGIIVSFFKTNLITQWSFVGLKNYTSALRDPDVIASFITTLKFTIMVVAFHFILGFVFALLLNRNMRGRTVFRAILLLPWLFPDVVIANLWKWIFHPSNGLLNSYLLSSGILAEPMSWLGNPKLALMAVALICIWKGYPLIMIQVLAALQTISTDILDAAVIDGANKRQIFLNVVLPGMQITLLVTLIMDTVWWFKHVTMIWLLTQGGPGTTTNTISVDIYKRAFEYFNFGSSSAIAVVVFLICVAISVGYRRILRND